ncbi:MAG: DinB family protein [Sphingobacteriales bacterium]|nr:MAG: DinB family protein [Sphingobacteriales bacterium]
MELDLTKRESQRLTEMINKAMQQITRFSSEEWEFREKPGKWSKKEILGHLIDSAANNHLRFVRAQLAESEFISFNYEQDFYVSCQQYQQSKVENLLLLWSAYNHHIAHIMNHINPEKLNLVCKIGNYEPVSLGFLVKDYVDHLAHHLKQLY